MSATYISIETNIERFEKYKALWQNQGITGIRANTMTDGIKMVIDIEKSKTQELYFIDIVADDIPDFMQQLSVLREETAAPILIATSTYTEEEHHEALNNGADFYSHFCETSEQNINGVLSAINSVQRPKKQKPSSTIITYNGVLISLLQRKIFVNDVYIELTRQEFDILHLLIENRGNVLTYKQIYQRIWGGEHEDVAHAALRKKKRRSTPINPILPGLVSRQPKAASFAKYFSKNKCVRLLYLTHSNV